jgi:hypothetical protein
MTHGWTPQSTSLLDGLGRVRRVKAMRLRRRFASLDTPAAAKVGGSYEEDGGGAGNVAARTVPDQRLIGGPLAGH